MRLYKSLLGLLLCLCLCLGPFCAPAQAAFPQKPKVTIALDTYDYDSGGSWSFGMLSGMNRPKTDDGESYYTWNEDKQNVIQENVNNDWDLMDISQEERNILNGSMGEYRKYWMRLKLKEQDGAQVAIGNFRMENSAKIGIWTAKELIEMGFQARNPDAVLQGDSTVHLDMVANVKERTDRQMNKVFAKAKLLCDITYYPGTQDAFTETIRVSTKNVKRETYYKEGGYRIWMETCEAANPPASVADLTDMSYLPKSVKEEIEIDPENYCLYIYWGFSQKQMPWDVRHVCKSLAEEQDGVWVENYVDTELTYDHSWNDMYENKVELLRMEVVLRKDGKSTEELENWLKGMAFSARFRTEFVGDEENVGYGGIHFTIPIDTSAVRFVHE